MISRVLSLGVALLALTTFVVSPSFAKDEEKADKDTHEGWVVKVSEGKLTMVGKDKKEHSHDIDAKTEITLDGKKAKLEDLKEKNHIFVTMKEKHVTKIEAHSKDIKDKTENKEKDK